MKTATIISLVLLALAPVPIYHLMMPYFNYWREWDNDYYGAPTGILVYPHESYVDLLPSFGLESFKLESSFVRLSCTTKRPEFLVEAETTKYEISSSHGEEDRTYYFDKYQLNAENRIQLSWNISSESTSDSDLFEVYFGNNGFQSGVNERVVKDFVYVNPTLDKNETMAFKSRHFGILSSRVSVKGGFKVSLVLTVWKRKYKVPESENFCKSGGYKTDPGTRAPRDFWFVLDNSNPPDLKAHRVYFDIHYTRLTNVLQALFLFLQTYEALVALTIISLTFPVWAIVMLGMLIWRYCHGNKRFEPLRTSADFEDLERNAKG